MSQFVEPDAVFSPTEVNRLVKWIKRYENNFLFFLHSKAEQVFLEFDRLYFERTAMTEGEYMNRLIDEVRQQASLAFTEMPSGENDTAFHYPEAQRQEAYRAFEARLIARCAKEEGSLRFKAYVARRYGLRVPLKLQQ